MNEQDEATKRSVLATAKATELAAAGVAHRLEVDLGDIHAFGSGAKSSGRKPRYDLIPTWALERIARRFELGAAKYGVDNWQSGLRDRDFIFDRINHAIDHLLRIRDEVNSVKIPPPLADRDDDAAAVILNAIFVMGYQQAIEKDRGARQAKDANR